MAHQTLDDRIVEARASLERLEQMKATKSCTEGHSWVFAGGCNASCNHPEDNCQCSIPVYECSVCGVCDYGDNDEAREIISTCEEGDDGEAK